MPGIKICMRLNLEDLLMLVMMVVGVIIAIHAILLALTQSTNSMVMPIPKPVVVGLIAP
jgi:flagellar biosynthesis protein FliQ